MTKLPRTITVCGKAYKILRRSRLSASTMGDIDNNSGIIRIRTKGTSIDQQLETLLHEVLHAIEANLGLDLPENTIHQMSAVLYAVLKENLK